MTASFAALEDECAVLHAEFLAELRAQYNDKLNESDIADARKIRPLLLRYMQRWLLETTFDQGDAALVERTFRNIYLWIAGRHIGGEDFVKKYRVPGLLD